MLMFGSRYDASTQCVLPESHNCTLQATVRQLVYKSRLQTAQVDRHRQMAWGPSEIAMIMLITLTL
jgi:hypothetical protein